VPETAIALFMIVMGVGIAGVWTADLMRGTRVDLSSGLLKARDDGGSLLLPHWVAEYGTAAGLIGGGIGLLSAAPWAAPVAGAALGATLYTSINSLGWALAEPSRRAYALPMAVGASGGLVALVALVVAG
jgi:hypothetical protein